MGRSIKRKNGGRAYETLAPGESWTWSRKDRVVYVECCDCGLRHRITLHWTRQGLTTRWYRVRRRKR